MSAESKFLSIHGLRLHYLDHGSPGKPPLICLHGLSGNAHHFDALAPRLAADWHVIALDVRGRGDSAWGPPDEYNAPVYVNDLAALLDTLGIARAALVGTSMGGIIAMMFAGGYPDRVTRLVLNDVGPEIDPAGASRIAAYMTSAPASFASLAELIQYYRATYPPLSAAADPEVAEFAQWSVRPDAQGRLVWKLDPAVRNFPRSGAAARPLDLWLPFARITAPVLALRGAASDVLARATAERMKVVLRGTTVVEVPGVGHAPSLQEPQALAGLKTFLAS